MTADEFLDEGAPQVDTRNVVYKSLRDFGASRVATAALMGDIQQESEFDPNHTGDRGKSFGLFQVGKPLFDKFHRDATRNGIRPNSPDYIYTQPQYILSQFKSQHPDRWEAMQNAEDAPTALKIFRSTPDWGYGVAGRRFTYASMFEKKLPDEAEEFLGSTPKPQDPAEQFLLDPKFSVKGMETGDKNQVQREVPDKKFNVKGGEIDASKIASTTSVPKREIRTQVGQETPLRQPGETARTRPQTQEVRPEQAGRVTPEEIDDLPDNLPSEERKLYSILEQNRVAAAKMNVHPKAVPLTDEDKSTVDYQNKKREKQGLPPLELISPDPPNKFKDAVQKVKGYFYPLFGPNDQQRQEVYNSLIKSPLAEQGLLPSLAQYVSEAASIPNSVRAVALAFQGKDVTPENLAEYKQKEFEAVGWGHDPNDSAAIAVVKALGKTLYNAAETITNPAFLSLPSSKAVSGAFGYNMLTDLPAQIKRIQSETTVQGKVEAAGQAAVDILAGGYAAKHFVLGGAKPFQFSEQAKSELRGKGYTDDHIEKMGAEQASNILSQEEAKPSGSPPPVPLDLYSPEQIQVLHRAVEYYTQTGMSEQDAFQQALKDMNDAPTPSERSVPKEGDPVTMNQVSPTDIGIAARYREEQQPGSVEPGQRQNAEYWANAGRQFINNGGDPRTAVRSAAKGNVSPKNVGIVRAEYERLAAKAESLAQDLEARPNDPDLKKAWEAATKEQSDWSREMQPVLTKAGEALAAVQDVMPVDETTFSGLYQRAMQFNGEKPPTAAQQVELLRRSHKVRAAKRAENAALNKLQAEIDRVLPKREVPTDADMQDEIDRMVKELTPCQ